MAHSALAVIETPSAFVLEGPDFSRSQVYGGLRLFGGGIEPGEDPAAAIIRELDEELLLALGPDEVHHIWTGPFVSQTRSGQFTGRDFSVFHVAIESAADLTLQVPGAVVELPKANLNQLDDSRLTRIAAYGLGLAIARGYTTIRQAA